MSESYSDEIRSHVPSSPPQVPPIDEAWLQTPITVSSADGLAEVTVLPASLEVVAVSVRDLVNPDVSAHAVVEATNAALTLAQAGPGGAQAEDDMDARMAQYEKAMDAISDQMDDLLAKIDTMTPDNPPNT